MAAGPLSPEALRLADEAVAVASDADVIVAFVGLPLAFEQEVLFRLYCSDDGQEGIEAFLDKRDPQFKGK